MENLEDRTLPAPVFTVNAPGDAGVGAGLSGDIRYCINQANISTNAGATILFNTSAIGGNSITLTHGELDISNTMTIDGPGSGALSISGDATGALPTTGTTASRVFNITNPLATVTLAGLTVTGGNGSPSTSVTPGNQGGDIFNGGTLYLENDVVQNGYVLGAVGGPPARGGGIFNAEGQTGGQAGATLYVSNTIVQNNEAQGAAGKNGAPYLGESGGPGGFAAGGGIYNDFNATVNIQIGTQIINNTSLGGKGGDGFHGVNGSNVSNGTGVRGLTGGSGGTGGAAMGGGIYNFVGGTLSITGSNNSSIVLTDNVAQGGAGGNGDFGGNGGNGGKLGFGGAGGAGGNGGSGGSTLGGGLYNSGTITSLQNAQFAGNQAMGGAGGNGSVGGNAGNGGSKGGGGIGGTGGFGGAGGSAAGGAIYSSSSAATLQIQNTQFTTDSAKTPVGNQAIGGAGGNGSNAGHGGTGGGTWSTYTNGVQTIFPVVGGRAGSGGPGGAGGNALGGAVVNAGGNVSFSNVTATTTLAQGGAGGSGGTGANGGTGGAHLSGGGAGLGGDGGAGGTAQGGGVYNSGGSLTLMGFVSTSSQAKGGNAGNGGNAGVGGVGGKGGGGHKTSGSFSVFAGSGASGGKGGAGGTGGAGQGGGFYNVGGALTVTDYQSANSSTKSQFTNDSVSSGNGGNGGNGGIGGVGGVSGKKFFVSAPGGLGGAGGAGGNAGYAEGGGGANAGGNTANAGTFTVNINDTPFTNDTVQAGSGGNGGNGALGGEGGDANANVSGLSGAGGNGGAGGVGGGGSTAQGGGLSVTAGTLDITNSTFGGSASLADQVLGGNGGQGGNGGLLNISGAPGHRYDYFGPPTPNGGKGGDGGAGTIVTGGGLAVSNGSQPSNLNILRSFAGIGANQISIPTFSNFVEPPDTQGAVGPSNYIETVNQEIAMYNKAGGLELTSDTLADFFFNRGGLARVSQNDEQSDSFIVYDSIAQRFIVGDLEFDNSFTDGAPNALLLAVSKTSDPTTLTGSDWYFYEVNTTQPNVYLQDYPGNVGYNADALVVTQNSFGSQGNNGTFVNAISMSALTSGAPLVSSGAGQNVFQKEYPPGPGQGQLPLLMRPVTMTGAQPGDPMWFVSSAGDGGQNIVGQANTITVVKMTTNNLFSTGPTFTQYTLNVNPYYENTQPLQPDGFPIFNAIDSRILNADEANVGGKSLIVADQNVANSTSTFFNPANQDMARWYEIDVSDPNKPQIVDQGDVSGGPGVYDIVPAIAINSSGAIGMTYMQIGSSTGQFLSMYVTGRLPTDKAGTMEPGQLVQAGAGDVIYNGIRDGDMAGINVDPTDNSFWAANEFATPTQFYNWGTAIAHFTVSPAITPVRTVSLSDSSSDNNIIVAGNGGIGGKGGVLPFNIIAPGVPIPIGGDSGVGGDGGDANGGGISLANASAQTASLLGVDISDDNATGGVGATGQFQDRLSLGLTGPGGSNSSAGGAGGSVVGAGLSSIDYNLTMGLSTKTGAASKIKGNVGTAGAGGAGGSYSLQNPDTADGGNGGTGGSADGGGIAFVNALSGGNTNLTLTLLGATVTNNQMTAAVGGVGGGAGTWGHDHILGGSGGAGGQALGGGLYVFAAATATNTTTIGSDTLDNNTLTAGNGANAGAGASATTGTAVGRFADGGAGGEAQGGGLYSNSLNQNAPGTLTINYSTMAGNQLTGGSGGTGGTGTTANGGPGGNGGAGGSADGGGFYDGNSTTLNVVNSTFGGLALSSQSATANSNILTAGSGGAGNNGGTPQGVSVASGGNGGNAGNTEGGGAYANSATSTFINDTIVNNLAISPGLAGAAGSGAGSGGKAGTPGTSGVGQGGGYFAVSGNNQVNQVGNSIIDLNDNVANLPASITGFDAEGAFASLGNNILGTIKGTSGFNITAAGTDMLATAAQLNLGPLLNNGGPTPTDALLNNAAGTSVAINGGSTTVLGNFASLFGVTSTTLSSATDQRGAGFPRIDTVSGKVDVGAYELDLPTITGVTGTTNVEGSKGVVLTISGTGFVQGATVSFGGATLTPTSVTGGQILVTDTSPLPLDGTVPVTVGNPDGSGIPGETLSSNTVQFTIAEAPFNLINPATGTTTSGGTITQDVNDNVNLQIEPAAPDSIGDVQAFSVQGLPPGLSISNTSVANGGPGVGVIFGTIQASAAVNGKPTTYNVSVTAYDGPQANGLSSTVSFQMIVEPFALGTVKPQTNNEGDTLPATGNNVLQVLTSTNSVTSNYTDVVGGKHTLPTGLTINATNGIISGTIAPYAATSLPYNVTITAGPAGATASTTFTWTVNDTTAPAFVNPPGNQANNIGDTLSAANNTGLQIQATDADAYTDVLNGQHTLPTGLSIDPKTGLITGTVTGKNSVTYPVTITATDVTDPVKGTGPSSTVSFIWTVTVPFGLINPEPVNNQGQPIPLQNDESDGVSLQMAPVSGYTASNYEASGLPTGLSINSLSGLISGTIDPRGAGTYTVTVQANDPQGQTASTTFTWDVNDTTPPTLTNPGPQTSTAGQNISHFAIMAQDADSGTWSATGLPQGLSIDANGVISGTIAPTVVGNFTVTIQAKDNGVLSSPMAFLWSVSAAPAGSPSSPPAASPPSAPAIPSGTRGLTTNLSIISVQNTYPGLVQSETVTVDVTNGNGFVVNEGVVTFQVNGQTLTASVVNGVAKITFNTSLVDPNELDEYLFSHPLTASYSDNTGIFASSGAGESVPAIWIDFLLSLLASQLQELNQTQTP